MGSASPLDQRSEIKFAIDTNQEVVLATAAGVFAPTGTTTVLIQAAKRILSEPASLLDLGCGTGVVGLALHLGGLAKTPLCASDLSAPAVECARENFARYGCLAEVRCGSLFEPWIGRKFDVIVDDISGVAQEVAALSTWFQGVPADTGRDGTALAISMLGEARNHLAPGGRLLFPVVSLSNVDLLLTEARKRFGKVERLARLEWPLPIELKAHLPLLRKLAQEGCIKLQERFGMVLCYTEAYCASSS